MNFAGNRCIPAKWRFDRIRPAFPPWREAVAVGVTAAQGTTPQGLWGLGAGPCRLHGGSTTDPSAAYAPCHATGGGIVSRGRCGGTTENEFNGIGGLPIYIRIVPVHGTFRTGERTF